MRTRHRLLAVLAASTMLGVGALSGSPAYAADVKPNCCGGTPCAYQFVYRPVNSTYVGKQYESADRVQGFGPGTITLSKAITVSNSWSGDAGVSAGDVSAKVGFSVTQSQTSTASFSFNAPDARMYTVYANSAFDRYEFDVHKFDKCGTDRGFDHRGWAKRFSNFVYGSYAN